MSSACIGLFFTPNSSNWGAYIRYSGKVCSLLPATFNRLSAGKLAKACGRCRMINVNPNTGIYRTDVMRELAKLRTVKNKVILGDLYYPVQTGVVDFHSEVKVFTNFNP